MLQKIKNLFREIGVLSLSIALAFVLFMGVVIVKGWTEPTLDAPNGNVGAPINTGSTEQTKSGYLKLSGGGAYSQGGLGFNYHSLNSNSNGWLYLGDQNKSVYGSRGLATGNLYVSEDAYFGSNSGIWKDNGSVGIGLKTPLYKLDVAGSINGNLSLCIKGDCKTSWPTGVSRTSCYWKAVAENTQTTCGSDEYVNGISVWDGADVVGGIYCCKSSK